MYHFHSIYTIRLLNTGVKLNHSRILRRRIHIRQEVMRGKRSNESANNESIPNPGIYDTIEDNAEYQEMVQVNGPSHYEQIQKSNQRIM